MKVAISDFESGKISATKKRYQLKEEAKVKTTDEDLETIMADRDFNEIVWEEDGYFFRVNPKTGMTSEEELIQHYKAVEYDEFVKKGKIIKNPDTQNLDLHRTIIGIIEECQRRGCTRKQLCFGNQMHFLKSWSIFWITPHISHPSDNP